MMNRVETSVRKFILKKKIKLPVGKICENRPNIYIYVKTYKNVSTHNARKYVLIFIRLLNCTCLMRDVYDTLYKKKNLKVVCAFKGSRA